MKTASAIVLFLSTLASASPLSKSVSGSHGYGSQQTSDSSAESFTSSSSSSSDSQRSQQSQQWNQKQQAHSQSHSSSNEYPSGMTTCPNNFGFKYAVQQSVFNNQLDPQFWTFLPLSYWKSAPLITGTSRRTVLDISGSEPYVNLWDGQRVKSDNIVVNMKGYLYTPETGTYTFTSSSGVKGGVEFLWVNQLAVYKSYTRGVANLLQYPGSNKVSTYTVDLKASQYVPIRVMYGHSTGDGHFDLKITSPSGKVLLGSNEGPDDEEVDSRYIIQTTCGLTVGNSLEQFADFGKEMF